MTPKYLIKELGELTTIDEAGRHFTEFSHHWEKLEDLGLIEVHRPVHERTGIPYDFRYWTLEVTEEGRRIVEDHPELFV